MFGLPRIICSGMVPACWSSPGCVVRGALVVLGLCWVVAGGLNAPRPSASQRSMGLYGPIDPLWNHGTYSFESGVIDWPSF